MEKKTQHIAALEAQLEAAGSGGGNVSSSSSSSGSGGGGAAMVALEEENATLKVDMDDMATDLGN